MQNNKSALIMAKPSELREALQAILSVIPQIKQICETDNCASTLTMAAQLHPALVVLDFDLPLKQISIVLAQIKATCSQAQSVVLVDNEQEYQMAKAAGADLVLIKGIQAAKLLAILSERLSTPSSPDNESK